MNKHFKEITLKATNAKDLFELEEIQSLWSGYGKILRIGLEGAKLKNVVAKHVRFPNQNNHPRGWNTNFSHMRKVKSYEVETAWYNTFAKSCDGFCRIPQCFIVESKNEEIFMVLEDLDSSGFNHRITSVSWKEIETCLKWLANFHATFMDCTPDNLWKIGTYWHLDTRPDELEVLDDVNLKNSASQIDEKLNNAKYLTFVHGDAKLANFCFNDNGDKVAAVDFQYVGGGCGMKDVAYFISSCLYEEDCEALENQVLDFYFSELKNALDRKGKNINFKDLENEWRELYPYAWTDFHRFLKGWSPGHWKINSYSERLAQQTINKLSQI